MLVGLDDTDSLKGGCTAYLGALLVEKLGTTGYPKLIRLNPNIPYKTRGNGAIAFQADGNPEKVKKTVLKLVEKHAHLKEEGTNPGIVFIEEINPKNERILTEFYRKTLSELVSLKEALKTAEKVNAEVHRFNNGRGVIGALAALGSKLPDKTYELIAYRSKKNYGKEKKIDRKSVFEMNKETYPETFDSIDPETEKILITPHGYDPVFCGVRGNTVGIVEKAFNFLKPLEGIERTQIFESNQGTDAHLVYKRISELKSFDCAVLKGNVSLNPQDIEGGHVIFGFSDGFGEIACAAYEPTGKFRDFIRELNKGDKVKVYGGVGKHPKTLNLEKIQVLKLEEIREKIPPVCCNKKMTSAGKGKGFKCRKCGRRQGENAAVLKKIPRKLKKGFYEVPPRARRHLSMPLIRMKSKNK